MRTILDLLKNSYFKRYNKAFLILIISTFFVSILEVFSLSIMIPFVQTFLGMNIADNAGTSSLTTLIFEYGVKLFGGDVVGLFLLFGSINIMRVFFTILRDIWKSHISNKIRIDTQISFFKKYINSDYDLYVKKNQGDLIYNTISLPAEVATLFNIIPKIIIESINFFMISSFLIYLSWEAYVALFLGGALLSGFILLLTKRKLKEVGAKVIRHQENFVGITQEMVNGVKEIKVNNLEPHWQSVFEKASHSFYKNKVLSMVMTILPARIIELSFFIALVGVSVFYAQDNLENFKENLPLGVVYVFAIFRTLPSVNSLLNDLSRASNFEFVLKKFNTAISEKTNSVTFGKIEVLSDSSGGVSCKNISFQYNKSHSLTLKDLNFIAPQGKTVALVGHSGSGKTTLINLILGLYNYQEGSIDFSSVPLRSLDINSVRNSIGHVSQDPFLFRGSIRENITLFSQHDDLKLKEALRISNCDEFIVRLKKGIDTEVGDKGIGLSGGQKQRICIARAIYKKPRLLILDEATSALDSLTEKKITQSIKEYSKSLSVIVLAHRLETIKSAHIIYVMKHGSIAESGTFSELMNNKGEFYSLYEKMETGVIS